MPQPTRKLKTLSTLPHDSFSWKTHLWLYKWQYSLLIILFFYTLHTIVSTQALPAQALVLPQETSIPQVTPQKLPGHTLLVVQSKPSLPTHISSKKISFSVVSNPLFQSHHAPSVSPQVIQSILERSGSPLADMTFSGGMKASFYIWNEGRVEGIDPSLLLSIFHHESGYGKAGWAAKTFSIGNIRPLVGEPALNGYKFYRTWESSVDDVYRLLRNYQSWGFTTVPEIIRKWAPPEDSNNTQAYIDDVEKMMMIYTQESLYGRR